MTAIARPVSGPPPAGSFPGPAPCRTSAVAAPPRQAGGFGGRRHGGRPGSELCVDAVADLGLVHERPVVHGQFPLKSARYAVAYRPGEQGLEADEGLARCLSELPRQSQRGLADLRPGDDRERHTPLGQFRAPVPATGEEDLPGQRGSEPLGEDQGGSRSRRESVRHVVAGVVTLRAEHGEVAEHAHGPARPDAVSLHGGDDGQFAVERQVVDAQVGELDPALLDRQQPLLRPSGSEVTVVAGEHHDAGAVVRLDLREGTGQPGHQAGREAVPVRAVLHHHQRDPRFDVPPAHGAPVAGPLGSAVLPGPGNRCGSHQGAQPALGRVGGDFAVPQCGEHFLCVHRRGSLPRSWNSFPAASTSRSPRCTPATRACRPCPDGPRSICGERKRRNSRTVGWS